MGVLQAGSTVPHKFRVSQDDRGRVESFLARRNAVWPIYTQPCTAEPSSRNGVNEIVMSLWRRYDSCCSHSEKPRRKAPFTLILRVDRRKHSYCRLSPPSGCFLVIPSLTPQVDCARQCVQLMSPPLEHQNLDLYIYGLCYSLFHIIHAELAMCDYHS